MSAEFLTLTTLYGLALLSPGQDFFLIVKYAMSYGYKKAWWSCFGIACGNAFYIACAYLGSEFLRHYPLLLSIIEWGSIGFLLYLGWLLYTASPPTAQLQKECGRALSSGKLWYMGTLSALLNPKNILFYFSLLNTIISFEHPWEMKLFYALWMVVMLLVWDMCVAFLFGNRQAMRFLPHLYMLQKGVGIVLMGFGMKVLSNILFV